MFLFPSIVGMMIQSDSNIFQRGWNHQPADLTLLQIQIWTFLGLRGFLDEICTYICIYIYISLFRVVKRSNPGLAGWSTRGSSWKNPYYVDPSRTHENRSTPPSKRVFSPIFRGTCRVKRCQKYVSIWFIAQFGVFQSYLQTCHWFFKKSKCWYRMVPPSDAIVVFFSSSWY